MQALRQFHTAKQGTITIQLPVDFPTTEVEVIILPKQPEAVANQQDEGQAALQSFFTMDTSRFTPEMQVAYTRACARLRQSRKPDDPPLFGLFEGLIEVADDVDAPLPNEITELFYGSETDEYGISLQS
ncbi:MAG: hypothetical protein R3E79_47540 [Caldilineaceae bacterium]